MDTGRKWLYRFHHKLRVRFAETDLQGIVFNGKYMTYYDVAWTEYYRAIGIEYKDLIRMGADTVLSRITMGVQVGRQIR